MFPRLSPPARILMGPGPSAVHPRVISALAAPTVGHLDPYYLELMSQMQEMLRQVFQTKNRMTMAISATGTAGMECTLVNLIEPGDRVLVCVKGVFGGRMADIAARAGAEVHKLERPFGEIFTPEEVEAAIKKVKPKLVAIVMAETSTGALQPLEEISKMTHAQGSLLVVDAVTSLGGLPVEVDRLEIDAIYSGSQKCLGCPPGLAPVSFSDRAMEAIKNRKTKVQSWYFDVSLLANYWGQDRAYHHTGPINMTYALHEGLNVLLEEGLTASFARHRLHHTALKAGLLALGLQYICKEGEQLPMLNAVHIPAGIEDMAVRGQLLQKYNIEIGGGLGAFKGKAWRIGLMGYTAQASNVQVLLGAIDQLLLQAGHKHTPGAGTAAANEVYAKVVCK